MPLILRQRIELKLFQAWDVVSPRLLLLTVLNPASLSLLSDPVPDPAPPSSASVRLDPWGLLFPGPLVTRFLTTLAYRDSGGRKDVPKAPVLSRGPQDCPFPLCPPSTRISGFLTMLCWALPPCPWFWPVPQIMLSWPVAGVDSIPSQNLTKAPSLIPLPLTLIPLYLLMPHDQKMLFLPPWDLPLPQQHHLQSSPLGWTSIQWSSKGVSIFQFMVFRQKASAEVHTCTFSTHLGISLILIFKTTHQFYGGLWELVREGNGTPLQYSCLENPMDGGAW